MLKKTILVTVMVCDILLGSNISEIDINNTISQWLNLRDLKLKDFISKDVIKRENNEYQNLKNLTRIYFDNKALKIYFFNHKEDAVMIYIEDETTFDNLSIKDIINKYDEPQEIVRSRGGKRANLHIYSKNGFSFSEISKKVIFFEIFPDCSLKDYKEKIYIKPSPFVK